MFYEPGPVRHWNCTSFDTERSWFRTADGKWNGIECLCIVGDRRKCSSLFSSAHGTLPGAWLFSERIVRLYLSFIHMIKLKYFLEIWSRAETIPWITRIQKIKFCASKNRFVHFTKDALNFQPPKIYVAPHRSAVCSVTAPAHRKS